MHAVKDKEFPVGALVVVDGKWLATVSQAFPEGSTSLLFPHYTVKFAGAGPGQVAVHWDRVGTEMEE